ncbi:chromatin associated protein KTI12 [Eremomyces bilateralis CBS 781.70]|uniref:Chromatin associated protein KTI12 n=1 Tax=Eremomyces bilateralis CBS 781.70 TaxID=1392243 RepID=A0A6G1GC83_9PEZI|nr:chromatin associated protein KTI12 [Eremomyces bilateralis CBS 781.70]KAF1815536.1 chromatin associated protein KTI12 [Eremomyces bilateralis CBS 781.70]
MPLILISGYPCSGKTHRATQLLEAIQTRVKQAPTSSFVANLKVHLVNDETLGLSHDIYGNTRAEKDGRAAEMSAIKRLLSKDAIVIADGLNYIKGYRYQLFCEAKAVGTTSCVVHVGVPADECRAANARRIEDPNATNEYAEEILENLIFRYEEPNGMTRWDSPLFIVIKEDAEPPVDAIWDALIGGEGKPKTVKPHMATVMSPTTPQDALQALHSQTTAVISAIQTFQGNAPDSSGAVVTIPGVETPVQLPMKAVGPAQLQRFRRQYVQMRRQGGLVMGGGEKSNQVGQVGGPEAAEGGYKSGFVEYLNAEFERP